MAKLTITEIKKQIAALEAKAARLAEEEAKASVGKVRALMNQLGVTLEHLSSTVARKGAASKRAITGKKPAAAKRAGKKGVAKYRDPNTGATWSGFGRAPGWIAGATNRDAFLVGQAKEKTTETGPKAVAVKKRLVAKKASAKKASAKMTPKTPVKRAAAVAKKVVSKVATPATQKRKPSIKAAAAKAEAKKAAKKKAVSVGVVKVPSAAESSGNTAT